MREGWRKGEFRDCVSEITSGKSVNSLDEPATGNCVGVLKTSCVYNGFFDPRENKRVVENEVHLVKCNARKGSIIVSRMNTASLVGASGLIEADYPNLVLPDRLWLVSVKSTTDVRWFACIIGSPEMRRRLSDAASGTSASMKNISQESFLNIPILIPSLPEQHKVAEILRTWDEAIRKASRIVELREAHYRALRDRLIDWQHGRRKALGRLVTPLSRPVPRPNASYNALSIRSHGKGTFIRLVNDPNSVAMETLYVARNGDLIVNITFAWEGAIALVPPEHDGCLVSHRFPTFVPNVANVDARFLRHTLRMSRFTHLLGLVSPGGAGRNRVLNKGDFLELEVPCPELRQQEAITRALDTAEAAIAKATEYRDALQRQKRGLMQKLLTGEWAVQPDLETADD
ncbi:type I restriction enzyme S subunit [Novosphingobium capsulatum]|uniref:Type I restriction enzyme S subunit n=1 Tax=Novosphingobium capsulatum TaxID=13688 RepID=A0ABU1MT69_9SPHN|nr:restriction endonuclease subunit S [Novosphingobium capsulatum]MDR6513358.1 type I restriction enzyme S subunit [Novosphingobium capsulatum]